MTAAGAGDERGERQRPRTSPRTGGEVDGDRRPLRAEPSHPRVGGDVGPQRLRDERTHPFAASDVAAQSRRGDRMDPPVGNGIAARPLPREQTHAGRDASAGAPDGAFMRPLAIGDLQSRQPRRGLVRPLVDYGLGLGVVFWHFVLLARESRDKLASQGEPTC